MHAPLAIEHAAAGVESAERSRFLRGLASSRASRALRQILSTPERIDRAFLLCIGRRPTDRERQRLSSYFDQQIGILRQDPKSAEALLPLTPEGSEPLEAAAWVGLSRVLLNLDEFITRE
jgi:hypothetical protein